MVPAFELEEIVRDARARTDVPGVAAALSVDGQVVSVADGVLELGREERVRPETPFRIASISKPFTASLALACLPADPQLRAWLSHTAGLRQERAEPLPEEAQGLFSYSNAGYIEAGRAAAIAAGASFAPSSRHLVLDREVRHAGSDSPRTIGDALDRRTLERRPSSVRAGPVVARSSP